MSDEAPVITVVSSPAGSDYDAASGLWSWTPDEADGPGAFAVTLRADNGIMTSLRTFQVTVTETNRPPTMESVPVQNVVINESWSLQRVASDPDLPVSTISSGKIITEIFSDFGTNGVEAADVEKKISSTSAALRVTFSSVTKIITLWYRTSSADAWKKHATFSTNNGTSANRRGNWRMNDTTGKFTLALYAGGDGEKVPADKMSLDNFVIRNLK
jgi:hypothetical protein